MEATNKSLDGTFKRKSNSDLVLFRNFLFYIISVMIVWSILASALRFQLVHASIETEEFFYKNKFMKYPGNRKPKDDVNDSKSDDYSSDMEIMSKSINSETGSADLTFLSEVVNHRPPPIPQDDISTKSKRNPYNEKGVRHVFKVTNDVIRPDLEQSYDQFKFRKNFGENIPRDKKAVGILNNERNKGHEKNINNVNLGTLKYRRAENKTTSTDVNEKELITERSSTESTLTTIGTTKIIDEKQITEKLSTESTLSTNGTTNTNLTSNSNSTTSSKSKENEAVKAKGFRTSEPVLGGKQFNEGTQEGYNRETHILSGIFDTVYSDIPGEPLTPADFYNAHNLLNTINVEDNDYDDPTTYAHQFEGDIRRRKFPEKQGTARTSLVSNLHLWPNKTVPYVISSTYDNTERSVIALSISNFELVSCIKFVPRTNQKNYVHFLKGDGCSSYVGMVGGAQEVSLGAGCLTVGVCCHELMHVLGFWHEQSRFDRDKYIFIHWKNIQPGMDLHFQKHNPIDLELLGDQYDLDSLMHYSKFVFAKNRESPTIQARKKGQKIGQRKRLSPIDVEKLNELYGCPNAAAPTFITNVNQITVTVPPLDPAFCVDSNPMCVVWAAAGECRNNAAWMKLNCKVSCNQCYKCDDLNDECSVWAKSGQCVQNPPYMEQYCTKSCGKCPEVSEMPSYPPQLYCADRNAMCKRWKELGECEVFKGYMEIFCRRTCGKC